MIRNIGQVSPGFSYETNNMFVHICTFGAIFIEDFHVAQANTGMPQILARPLN